MLRSLVGSEMCIRDRNDAKEILKKSKQKNVEILLPVDSLNTNEFKNNLGTVTNIFDIPKGSMGLDIGPASISLFEKEIDQDILKNSLRAMGAL